MSPNESTKPSPARIHLLAAKEAPYVVVIRRKPSRHVHVIRWNTRTDTLEQGSWFKGRLYEMRSDVSFDGRFMIYLAMGASGKTWTGVCHPPFLQTVVHWSNMGTWHGGGLFSSPTCLEVNPGYAGGEAVEALSEIKSSFPFDWRLLDNPGYGEDEGVLYPRFERDGFRRAGPHVKDSPVEGSGYETAAVDDPGWVLQPSSGHPELRVRYRGYASGRGRIFEWDLPNHSGLLDKHVSWATYDALGQLIVARMGVLYRYRLDDLLEHRPSAVFDLEPLAPPSKQEEQRQ